MIPAELFIDSGKMFHKFIWNYKWTRITKLFLRKNKKVVGITYFYSKHCTNQRESRLCDSKNFSILGYLMVAYSQLYSFKVLCISMVSVVTFLILFIWVFSFFPFVNLAKDLSILFFSKNQLFINLFCCLFSLFHLFPL